MYSELMATRWTNMASPFTFWALLIWIVGLAGFRFLDGGNAASWDFLAFVLVSLVLPTVIIGDNKQYRALGMTRKQAFISELMLLIPLTLIATLLFVVGSTPLVWGLSALVFVFSLGVHYWGIADHNADKRVLDFFGANKTQIRGNWRWAGPMVQLIYIPAVKGAIVLTVVLTLLLVTGLLADGQSTDSFNLEFVVVYIGAFLASLIIPSLIQKQGGAGAWHAFGLPRKQYIAHSVVATLLGSFLAGAFALLVSGAINMAVVEQSAQKFVLGWIMWAIAGTAMVAIMALLNQFANFIFIVLMVFYLSVYTNDSHEGTFASLGPITAVIGVLFAAIGTTCAFILIAGRNGKRMTLEQTSLTKFKA